MARRAPLALLGLASVAGCTSAPPPSGPERPDVVVILADDMGYSDIGPYGGEIRTPHLDRLAAGGLRFTQFYNTARCCPTRAALLTGLYSHQAGVGHMMADAGEELPGYRGELSDDSVTIAEALSDVGYRTYMAGKWHVTRQVGDWTGDGSLRSKHNWPLQRGFDRFYGTIHGAGSFFDPVSLTAGNEPTEPDGDVYYYTDAISSEAVRFVREHRDATPDTPFFLYVAYTAPHWPLHALPEDIARYHGRYAEGWDALRVERRQRMIELGLVGETAALTERDPDVPAWDELGADERTWFERAMEVYAAQVDRMDQGIGRILEALEAGGRLDDTLVLFLSDNGGCAERLSPSWGGLHIPRRARDGSPVAVGNDIATLPGSEASYQSYGPHWANASNTPFRLYKHWVHEGGISTPLIGPWELYDMEADRSETRDLAGEHPEQVERLAGLYGDWAARNDVQEWEAVREALAARR